MSGSDPKGLGQWPFIKMYGKEGNSLVIITGYRVCDASVSTTGASTPFHQQWHLLRMTGDKNPNPRKQFITDLTVEIRKWQNEGADIILGGDFNERLGETQDGLAQLVTQCNLVDPHAINHGTDDKPNTYSWVRNVWTMYLSHHESFNSLENVGLIHSIKSSALITEAFTSIWISKAY
jgi:hypothetical protein